MIPKKIHQYWDVDPAPSEAVKAFEQLSQLNPGFSATLWSRDLAVDFIGANFGDIAADCFLSCKIPAMQSDFFRYCVLLVEGGVYLDSDDIALTPFDRWLAPEDELVLPMVKVADRVNRSVSNCFIASGPGNPILAFCVGQCVANIACRVENDVWEVTGPKALARGMRFKRDLVIRLVDPRDDYLLHFASGASPDAKHWSVRQGSESIFTQTAPVWDTSSGLQNAFSQQFQLANAALFDSCIQNISAGIYLSQWEAGLDQSQSSTSALRLSSVMQYGFDDQSIESISSKAEFKDSMARWRRNFVGERLALFDSRFKGLRDQLSSGGCVTTVGSYGESPGMLLRLAKSLAAEGDTDKAAYVARSAVFFSDYHPRLWIRAGDLFLSMDAYVEAEALSKQVIAQDPSSPEALFLLGRVSDRKGDVSAATMFMRLSVAGERYVQHVWLGACQFFLRNKLYGEALSVVRKAQVRDPRNPAVLNLLARAHENLGDMDDAIIAAKQFVSVSGIETSFILLARLQFVSGDSAAAKSTLEVCDQRFPESERSAHLADQMRARRDA